MNIFVPYIAPSTNAMYAGQHWHKRVKNKRDAALAVLVAINGNRKTFINPVRIDIEPHLGKGVRAYDVSNYSYTYKLIEDALVAQKILQGDDSKFVKEVRFLSPVRSIKTGINLTIIEQ